MKKELVMGNQAIALGALDAGVSCVCGYPGTPSTEIIETIYKCKCEDIHTEWSVNEKVALEVAAGASYSGYRSLVTMKQVGLNVCADPAMNLSYIGVEGGMVIVVADDPGPISSQTEQDTRMFSCYAKIPLLDPQTPEEAYNMTKYAFELSEKYKTPVILRPTTRICHSYTGIIRKMRKQSTIKKGFVKKDEWVCFPTLSYINHLKVEKRIDELKRGFELLPFYEIEGSGNTLILTSSVNYSYVMEAINFWGIEKNKYTLVAITTFPIPERLIDRLLVGKEKVLILEDLDAVIEKAVYSLCGKMERNIPQIIGKEMGVIKKAGENSVDEVIELLGSIFELSESILVKNVCDKKISSRKPALCAGCPHRAAFYVVKQAMKGENAIFCGDIGCYTLGKMPPLNMLDTCLCMGAGVTLGLGIQIYNPESKVISFIGDSTFFHTGIQGILNGIYNNENLTVVILDNSSTAMTGGQPTPEAGAIAMETSKISIEQVLAGLGVKKISTISPLKLKRAIEVVKETIMHDGIKAIIFKAPCKKKQKEIKKVKIQRDKCNNCGLCISELGCPAIHENNDLVAIDTQNCNGCGLCVQICKKKAPVYIGGENE